MALTTAQRMDLTGDLGIPDDESVFSDDELNRFYARAGGTENDYEKALYYAVRRLLMDPVLFDRYAECKSDKTKEQLRDILAKMLEQLAKTTGMGLGKLSAGKITTGIDQPDPSTDTSLSDYLRDF